jgi:HEAT repeat protein
MKKTTILLLLFLAGISHASIQEIAEQLGSTNLMVQTEAQGKLLTDCSNAGRPGAEAERKAICEEICEVLKTDLPAPVASQLVHNLQRIGGKESVATLVSMLGSSDLHLRDDVRQALAVNPSSKAGKALKAELKKAKEPRWTAGLIMAFGERDDARTSKTIVPYLESNDPQVFTATAKTLTQLGESRGIKAMAKRRAKEDGERKATLTAALFETDREDVFKKLYDEKESDEVRAVALVGLVLNNKRNVATDAMASGNAGFQSAVIEAASQSKDEALYALLAKNLDHLPSHLQTQALGVLEFSGDKQYSCTIVPLLVSTDSYVQTAAAQALSKIGTADAIPALLASGTEEAKKAMGLIDAKGVDDALMLAAESGDGARRAVAIEALALRGHVQLMDQFFAYSAESGEQVAKAAVLAIDILGRDEDLDQVIALLLANEKSALSRNILKAAVSITRRSLQQDKAVEVLVGRLSVASPQGQALILKVLAQVGSPVALVPVAQAVQTDDEVLRKQVVKLLGNWPNTNAVPVLLEIAADDSASLADHVVSIRGISRLLSSQKKIDEEVAIKALGICRRSDEKKLMLGVLAKTKSPEAKRAVRACLSDPELKIDAEETLKQMGNKRKKK